MPVKINIIMAIPIAYITDHKAWQKTQSQQQAILYYRQKFTNVMYIHVACITESLHCWYMRVFICITGLQFCLQCRLQLLHLATFRNCNVELKNWVVCNEESQRCFTFMVQVSVLISRLGSLGVRRGWGIGHDTLLSQCLSQPRYINGYRQT